MFVLLQKWRTNIIIIISHNGVKVCVWEKYHTKTFNSEGPNKSLITATNSDSNLIEEKSTNLPAAALLFSPSCIYFPFFLLLFFFIGSWTFSGRNIKWLLKRFRKQELWHSGTPRDYRTNNSGRQPNSFLWGFFFLRFSTKSVLEDKIVIFVSELVSCFCRWYGWCSSSGCDLWTCGFEVLPFASASI